MRSTRAWVWVGLASALVALACDSDHGGTKPAADAGGGADAGQITVGSVQGLVVDTKGDGIQGVTVNVGGKTAMTDKDGLFDVAEVPEGEVQVAVEDKALSAAQTSVTVKGEQKANVALTADESVVVAIDNLEKGGTIEKDGVVVVLPENSLHKGDGSVATGAGEMRFVSVAEPGKAKAAPGGMKATQNDQPVQLAPDGAIDIRFYQGLERLVFVGEADLTFPLGPNKKLDGDEVTVWSFDESSGKWKEEGKGTVQRVEPEENGSVKTKAKHFTWWASAEVLADATCVQGNLSSAGSPVSGALVEAVSSDSLLYVQATSGDDGSFCLAAPQEATVQVTAFGSEQDALLTWLWHAETASEPASCGGACSELPAQEPTPFMPGGGERDAGPQPVDAGMDAALPDGGGDDMDATVVTPDAGPDDAGLTDAAPPIVEICTNLADDDGDDLVDCQDPDCAVTDPSCTGLYFHGDGAYVSTASSGDAGTSTVADTQQLTGTVEFWFRANFFDVEIGAGLVDINACGENYLALTPGTAVGTTDAGVPPPGIEPRVAGLVSTFTECDGPGNSIVTLPDLFETGRWYHVARTWTATDQTIYIDGVMAIGSGHTFSDLNSGGLNPEFGHRHSSGFDNGFYFNGDMDEVRVWNYARSAQQIAGAFRQSIDPQSSGLLGYWPLNEGTGDTTADATGNGHDGTLHSNPNWFTPFPDTQ